MEGSEGKWTTSIPSNFVIINGMTNMNCIKLDQFIEAWRQEARGQDFRQPDKDALRSQIHEAYLESGFAHDLFRHAYRCSDFQEQHELWWKPQEERIVKQYNDFHENRRIKPTASARPKGSWAFSFTYSPRWYPDDHARVLMKQACERLVKYYRKDIDEFIVIGEVGTNGLSHVHGYYALKSGHRITEKSFQRAYEKWDSKIIPKKSKGHQGGYHRLVAGNEGDYLSYINKDDDPWCSFILGEKFSHLESINHGHEEEGAPPSPSDSDEEAGDER
jgi:hypothetical protein